MLDKSTEAKANHWVLVNKKTGKVASSNNWLLALAAHAQTQRNTSGIASLLSHDKAKRTLVRNELALKPMRGIKNDQVTANVRLEARAMLPYMAAVFGEKKSGCAAVSKNEFCTWITEQLYDPLSDEKTCCRQRQPAIQESLPMRQMPAHYPHRAKVPA